MSDPEEPEEELEALETPAVSGIETHRAATRTALVCPDVRGQGGARTLDARLEEFHGLAEAIELDIVFEDAIRVREIKPATFLGSGHVEALKQRIEAEKVELLLVDAQLSPIQQRNLERETGAKVLDRTALILEIFGARAATREGVLQVELAHLNYQKSRLVRSWTHLERQRGGFGFLGGPGETQIESDRRLLQERIAYIEKRLEKVRKTRALQRRQRDTIPFPIVALVGYTNAGKSSLFNRMTGAGVRAEDLLFATLDTTVRRVDLPHGRGIILSDTVGFVADLPTDLVAAFRATLEEVMDADIILHVRDIANPDHAAQAADVLTVLADLGVTDTPVPIIEVWNKLDRLNADPDLRRAHLAAILPVGSVRATLPVSAHTGEGIDDLLSLLETVLAEQSQTYELDLPYARSGEIGWLYAHTEVIERREEKETASTFHVRVDPRHKGEFLQRFAGLISLGA